MLGAHYSLDVAAGRIQATYDVAQLLNNNPAYLNQPISVFAVGNVTTSSNYAALFQAASADLRTVLAQGCGGTVAACAGGGGDRLSDPAQNRAAYEAWLTYNLLPTGLTNLAAVVPAGSEVLLATRLPFLTAAQRRDVLASTELASGGALDNGTGWARLDLLQGGQRLRRLRVGRGHHAGCVAGRVQCGQYFRQRHHGQRQADQGRHRHPGAVGRQQLHRRGRGGWRRAGRAENDGARHGQRRIAGWHPGGRGGTAGPGQFLCRCGQHAAVRHPRRRQPAAADRRMPSCPARRSWSRSTGPLDWAATSRGPTSWAWRPTATARSSRGPRMPSS